MTFKMILSAIKITINDIGRAGLIMFGLCVVYVAVKWWLLIPTALLFIINMLDEFIKNQDDKNNKKSIKMKLCKTEYDNC